MAARIALFFALVLTVIGILVFRSHNKTETAFAPPAGYAPAHAMAKFTSEEPFVSALDYANAFSPETKQETIAAEPVKKPAKKLASIAGSKHKVKRHLARAKSGKRPLLAVRW